MEDNKQSLDLQEGREAQGLNLLQILWTTLTNPVNYTTRARLFNL